MERVVVEGEVATANTLARLLSSLPQCGRTTRVMLYDLHTLQNRFYMSSNAVATMHSTIPLLLAELDNEWDGEKFDCIAFPDDGAAKRFGSMFAGDKFGIVVCGKKREGNSRKVRAHGAGVHDVAYYRKSGLVAVLIRNVGLSSEEFETETTKP
eukprot:5771516-Pyramimonas_sp.AAC.1